MTETREPMKLRITTQDGDVIVLHLMEGEEVIAAMSTSEAEWFGVTLSDAVGVGAGRRSRHE